ncbi:hypothetical protein F4777DRAFT_568222 [Nemania sp. FL0916]|nr:hypothetical protein F4777DRAFT_568222 [Nemania sp. FL0916]
MYLDIPTHHQPDFKYGLVARPSRKERLSIKPPAKKERKKKKSRHMANYTASYPATVTVDEKLTDFISSFYAISDDPSRNAEWVDYFAPDALVVIADKKAKGTEEIREMREGMWATVTARRHVLGKVFPAVFDFHTEPPQLEYMLHGSVEQELKIGGKLAGDWAAHAVVREEGGRLKYELYHVYINVR